MTAGRAGLVIIDDNPTWRDGLARAVQGLAGHLEIRYSGPLAREAIRTLTGGHGTTLALVDAHQADGSPNLTAVRTLAAAGIWVAIVTAHAEPRVIGSLVAAGANACIPKGEVLARLDGLLETARANGIYLTAELAAGLLPSASTSCLSAAQEQVLQWHAAGLPLEVALRDHDVSGHDFEAGIRRLVAALRDHGTIASSSCST